MRKQTERIIHGASFSGIVSTIGSIMCVASILMFGTSISYIIPLILLITGLIFLASIELTEIDYSQRKIRKALHLIFYKHGEWVSFDNFDRLVLGADYRSFRMISPAHPIFQKDIRIKAYDIYIVNSNDSTKAFLLLSCDNIPLAQKKLGEYATKLNLEMIDTIKQEWERVRERERR